MMYATSTPAHSPMVYSSRPSVLMVVVPCVTVHGAAVRVHVEQDSVKLVPATVAVPFKLKAQVVLPSVSVVPGIWHVVTTFAAATAFAALLQNRCRPCSSFSAGQRQASVSHRRRARQQVNPQMCPSHRFHFFTSRSRDAQIPTYPYFT